MTTKKATKKITSTSKSISDIFSPSNEKDLSWTRERALELAIDMFKQPFFSKEANAYAIVSLADTFSKFVADGKDAAFPSNAPIPVAPSARPTEAA